MANINTKNYQFQWGERHSMISSECWAFGYGAYCFGKPIYNDCIVTSEGKYLTMYASVKMIQEAENLSRKALTQKGRMALLKVCNTSEKKYWALYKKYLGADFSKLSDKKLLTFLNNYVQITKRIANCYDISQANGTFAVVDTLTQKLTERGAATLLEKLVTSPRQDIIAKEREAAAKLKNDEKVLLKHAQLYAWLFFNSYSLEENLEYLRNRIGSTFNRTQERRKSNLLNAEQNYWFKKFTDPEIKILCRYLQELSIGRLRLKDCWGGGEFRFLKMFKELATRIGLPLPMMMASYTLYDYHKALLEQTYLDFSAIKSRQEYYVWIKKGAKLTLVEDKKAQSIIKKLNPTKKIKTPKIIKGSPVNKGTVIGIVKIIKSLDVTTLIKDIARFKKGEILVTWMTQPNMLPIAQKAAAIIADEGGITSHAAIIARELNIPCIVGAKHATVFLKDGDKIKVDANKGEIEKLN